MAELALTIQRSSRLTGLPARSTLRRWIGAALKRDAHLTLRFVGAGEARRLNSRFRGGDYAADVLTFNYASAPQIHADIVVCVPVARRAARALGKPVYDHLAHLVVHAVLHAQGHDHGSARTARAMEARERSIMRLLGKSDPYTVAPAPA